MEILKEIFEECRPIEKVCLLIEAFFIILASMIMIWILVFTQAPIIIRCIMLLVIILESCAAGLIIGIAW